MSIKKIAHVTLSMDVGGIENLILSLILNGDSNKFNFYCYCLDQGGSLLKDLIACGVKTRIMKRNPGLDLILIWNLFRTLRHDRIDVLHTHNQAAHFYGCIAGKLACVKMILNTEHSRHYIEQRKIRRWEKRILSSMTTRMFIVSNELKQSAINSDCIHPKKLQVVNNGVDVDKFKRVSSSRLQKLRLAFGISHDERLITIVARLHPLKNHKLLLQAMRELINYEPKARLLIVGEGELRTELEYIARELGLDSKISFLGDRRDIPDILNLTEVFVLCSVKEGLPLVLLESMAAEVPIVVTSGANKSKIIEHGKTGLQVRPTAKDLAKSIFLLLQDKQLSQCLAENAKKNIEQSFSVKNTVRTYQDFYLNCNSPDYNKI